MQRPLAQGALDDQPQVLEIDRLGQEVGGAQPHRLHGIVDGAEPRRDDHVRGQPVLLYLFQQLQTVDPRHLEIGDDHAVGALGQRLERIAAIGGRVHAKSGVGLQEDLDLLAGGLVVFHDQDAPPGLRNRAR